MMVRFILWLLRVSLCVGGKRRKSFWRATYSCIIYAGEMKELLKPNGSTRWYKSNYIAQDVDVTNSDLLLTNIDSPFNIK